MMEDIIENLAYNKEIYFKVKVTPNAPKTEFKGKMSDGTIKIALAAQPEKGRANKELLDFLANELGVRKYQVEIVGALTDKHKTIKVSR